MTVVLYSVCYHDVGECVVPSRTTTTSTAAVDDENGDTDHEGIGADGRGGGW